MSRYRSRIFEMAVAAALTLVVPRGAAAQTTEPMVLVAPAPTPSVQSLHGLNPFQPMQQVRPVEATPSSPHLVPPHALQPILVPRPTPHLQRAQPVLPTQTGRVIKPAVPRPSGFAVVLVLGDLKGAAGSDVDVPPAARKALADMKDFLPYKSYQLLDTQWTIGAGQVRSRLRGLDNQEYELELDVSRHYETGSDGSPGTRAVERVTFRLREARTTSESGSGEALALRTLSEAQETAIVQTLQERRLADLMAKLGGQHADVKRQQEVLAQAKTSARLAETQRQVHSKTGAIAGPLIDTSFPMQVGETVVVGTSRLQGDKALIVVLTAAGR